MSDFLPEILKITRYKVFQPQYSAHWIQLLASATGVEVAIDSAVAIYVMQELQVPLGLRSL